MKARLLVLITVLLPVASAPLARAQTFQELFAFEGFGIDGEGPWGGLIQATDGYFYGTTFYGGTSDFGTAFKITADGTLTTLASFDGVTNDQHPNTTMIEWIDGNFYGYTIYPSAFFKLTPNGNLTASGGGGGQAYQLSQGTDSYLYGAQNGDSSSYGSLFRFRPDEREGQLLHWFEYDRGYYEGLRPCGSPIEAKDGNFYGVTSAGGAYGYGVLYRVTTNGNYTVLWSFSQGPSGGGAIWPCGPLLQASDGYLYGVAHGCIFRATTNGVVTTFASFDYLNGDEPNGGLVEGNNGNFYGTCAHGGALGLGSIGTVFRVTPDGVITALVSFSGTAGPFPGANPRAGLVQGSDGNLYGTTSVQGSRGGGNVFRVIMPGPKLDSFRAGQQLVLSWRTNYTGFQLQSSPVLGGGNWSGCTNSLSVIGGQFFVTNSLSGGAQFFRLKK